ncbi:MAG: RluA family pseudouridine synthase [Candidatus Rokubacteria bacterium]|nr:RluA family pseudouridine synthase [Candidatus Rokubacteria bacterium]
MKLAARLAEMFPDASRRAIKGWLEGGRVRVGGQVVRRGDLEVAPADRVEVGEPPPPAFPPPLKRIYEDDDIVVIDKPPGLLTIATAHERERTAYHLLTDWLRAKPGGRKYKQPLFIVHRLDRETSGLVVFAKNPPTKLRLQDQFEARTVERIYVAVVEGRVPADNGTLRDELSEDRSLRVRRTRGRDAGRVAITHYRVVERRDQSTVLELRLETGRRGQIRAQLAALGHPIVGDRRYGARRDPIRRLCLHAARLGFLHARGKPITFRSQPPPEFRRA